MRNQITLIDNLEYFENKGLLFTQINLGELIAKNYVSNPKRFMDEISFDAKCYLRKLVDTALEANLTNILFSNIGILLEKDFGLDVPKFFLDYAKDGYEVYILKQFSVISNSQIVWQVESSNRINFESGVLHIIGDEDEIF